jgi:hypothetical protein
MGWTKSQFVVQAFDEIGLAAYAYDLTTEQLESALRRLDSMMATWNAKGIRLGYPIPASPQDSDLDADTQVPDSANEAIYSNLSIRLAPSFGKTPTPELKSIAKSGYDVLLSRAALPAEQQLGPLPAGAGNKPFNIDGPFLAPKDSALEAGPDSDLDFN